MPHLRTVFAVAVALAAVASTGCASRSYVQASRVPSSSEMSFTWIGGVDAGLDGQVDELPSQPPALGELHRARNCGPIGPKFPPITLVTLGERRDVVEKEPPRRLASAEEAWIRETKTLLPNPLVRIEQPPDPHVTEPIGQLPMASVETYPSPVPKRRDARPIASVEDTGRECEIVRIR